MALSSFTASKLPPLIDFRSNSAVFEEEKAAPDSTRSSVHTAMLRSFITPTGNPKWSDISLSSSSSGVFSDGNSNSDLRRRAIVAASSSPATDVLYSSRRRRVDAPTSAAVAVLPQDRVLLAGSNGVGLQRAGTRLLHTQNRSAKYNRFHCRAATSLPGGVTFDDVPHLSQWLPDLPRYPNPLVDNPAYKAVTKYFVDDDDVVAQDVLVKLVDPSSSVYFRRSGPRKNVCFKGDEVRACIVTCGGLCPGLNTVIREIVCGLWTSYGVRDIIGIEGGYEGFYSRNTTPLNPKLVNDIHKKGGTMLGTSRGGHDKTKIIAAILDRGINQVYIIGGDGTQRGAAGLHEELKKLGVKVVVAGIPKTIDNDIGVIDKSFGFDTAVEEAQRAINAAHVEAESAKNGIGLVKLMGRYSGYIAMYATLASRDVDCCLIPEVPFYVEGEGGLYEFVRSRLRENGHMVIVVAEGAGQELMAESSQIKPLDASGNRLLLDVGLWLSQKLKDEFAANKEPLTLKYIDPTYMVRAIPSNASDNVYCTLLAHSAMHGAMAGYTGFISGPVNERHAYIPIGTAVATQNNVNTTDRMWARLLSSTQQPDFFRYEGAIVEKRESLKARKTTTNGIALRESKSYGDQVLKKEPKP